MLDNNWLDLLELVISITIYSVILFDVADCSFRLIMLSKVNSLHAENMDWNHHHQDQCHISFQYLALPSDVHSLGSHPSRFGHSGFRPIFLSCLSKARYLTLNQKPGWLGVPSSNFVFAICIFIYYISVSGNFSYFSSSKLHLQERV